MGGLQGDVLRDAGGHLLLKIDGDDIRDASGKKIASVTGDDVRDSSGRKIATLADIRKSIDGALGGVSLVAIWLAWLR